MLAKFGGHRFQTIPDINSLSNLTWIPWKMLNSPLSYCQIFKIENTDITIRLLQIRPVENMNRKKKKKTDNYKAFCVSQKHNKEINNKTGFTKTFSWPIKKHDKETISSKVIGK